MAFSGGREHAKYWFENRLDFFAISHILSFLLVRTVLGDSLIDIVGKPRTNWVLRWPGQIVIAGSQTVWTAGVEDGIRNDKLGEFLRREMLVNVSKKY